MDHQRVAFHPGDAGLGLDIGMLDVGGLEACLGDVGRRRERGLGVAGGDAAADQFVAGPGLVERRGGLALAFIQNMRKWVPGNWEC